ncbi:DoxX family protein [Mycobacterium sp. 236(2023)]|uniref:DoxX family protein n=1 Tax=Mycobacterium sp. 236(2023) TaxID=3038163 RepID=UPI002415031B|nr:DoxX family protein [Mycobacterium sp. 236(2023)]MDG4665975.1 DoxX family protein [Mycobacterium sp. 236(2023)]
MTTALAAVTVVCAVANAGVAVADLVRAPFVLANSAEVGVAQRWIPYLASLKMSGAVGLLLGYAVAPWLGLAAAAGLVAFFIGAVAVHVHTRVLHNIAFPGAYLVLALGALGYFTIAVS